MPYGMHIIKFEVERANGAVGLAGRAPLCNTKVVCKDSQLSYCLGALVSSQPFLWFGTLSQCLRARNFCYGATSRRSLNR